VALEGVTYSEFAGERLVRRVRAEQLVVVPKQMGILQLSPVSELVLTRPAIEIFEASGDGTRGADAGARDAGASLPRAPALLGSVGPALPGLAAARHVLATTLFEPTFTFFRGGAPVARLEAARASADVRSRDLELRRVRVEHISTGRRLTADRAVWLADAGALWIEGAYVLWEGGASTRGRGLRVDVQLRPAASR
jgi:hypothetical protein